MKKVFLLLGLIVGQLSMASSNPKISFNADVGANERIEHEIMFHARNMGFDSEFSIRINFSLNLPKGINGTSQFAEVNGSNQILITVNRRLHRSKKIETIVHELIHAWQFAYQDLKRIDEHFVKWRGELIDLRKVRYGNRPWEKEAYELARILRKKYDKKHK